MDFKMSSLLILMFAMSAVLVVEHALAQPGVYIGRPGFPLCDDVYVTNATTAEEIQKLVADPQWTEIQAIGFGISFSQWACPAKTASPGKRLMIRTTGLNSFMELDEKTSTVTVDTGFRVADLSRYLQTKGYSLQTYGFFLTGTVGGSFLAGFHGSSPRYGTTSSSIVAAQVVLANGTLVTVDANTKVKVTLPAGTQGPTRLAVLPALRMSVGRLGIVTRLTIKVIKDYPVYRKVTEAPVASIPALLNKIFTKGNEDKTDGTMISWYPALNTMNIHSYERRDDLISNTTAGPAVAELNSAYSAMPGTDLVPAFTASILESQDAHHEVYRTTRVLAQKWFKDYLYNSPWEVNRPFWHSVGLAETFYLNWFLGSVVRFGNLGKLPHQFEVAVDFKDAAACFYKLKASFDKNPRQSELFIIPFLIRAVNGEAEKDVLLSPTLGKKAVYFRIDHFTLPYPAPYNADNVFQQLEKILLSKPCNGRVHWNLYTTSWEKYGKLAKKQYGVRLAQFSAIAKALDPKGKFATELDAAFF